MKKCSKCKEEKPFEEFFKSKTSKDGRRSSCKECHRQYREDNKERILERQRQYYEKNREKIRKEYREKGREKRKKRYENNKEKIREQRKQYRENNREKIKERQKRYRENNKEKIREYYEKNREKILERKRRYSKENKEKIREWNENHKEERNRLLRERRKNDPEFRLRHNIRGAFYKFLKRNKEKPTSEYLKDCGYTRKELMKHLEDQFDQNMNWDNYGSYWHVDHIIPQSVFEPTNDQHLKWCWSLENLRPLRAWENMSKNTSIILEEVEKISFYEDVKHLLKD